jgi:TonB family protein
VTRFAAAVVIVISSLLVPVRGLYCEADDKQVPKPQGQVEVSVRPLKPDLAKLKSMGLQASDVEAPIALAKSAPSYPEDALKARMQGDVALRCVIGTDGAVNDCQITRSLSPECDGAAVAAAEKWLYTPTKLKGQAVSAYLTIHVKYRLVKKPRP